MRGLRGAQAAYQSCAQGERQYCCVNERFDFHGTNIWSAMHRALHWNPIKWRCVMTTLELLPKLQALPRAEKLHVMQFLLDEIAREEELPPFASGAAYPIWSPYDASAAAATLQDLLEQEKRGLHG